MLEIGKKKILTPKLNKKGKFILYLIFNKNLNFSCSSHNEIKIAELSTLLDLFRILYTEIRNKPKTSFSQRSFAK